MNRFISLSIAILVLTSSLFGQNTNEKNASPLRKNGAEFNVVWPFVPGVGIYTGKYTREIWKSGKMRGDLTLGFLARPAIEDDNAEQFSEIGLNIGYRHYFWKGFHAELAIYPSRAKEVRNKIDGKDYQGFALTTEFYSGYKFDFLRKEKFNLYLMPQAGIGYNGISNLGPNSVESGVFPTLNLQLGINF